MVRGWLIVGAGPDAGVGLPMGRGIGGPTSSPVMPNAADYQPGDWLLWQPIESFSLAMRASASWPLALVCVELPL